MCRGRSGTVLEGPVERFPGPSSPSHGLPLLESGTP